MMQPFTGSKVNQQLKYLAKVYANDPLRVKVTRHKFTVSQLFKWHIKDFKDEQAIIHHLHKYATGSQKIRLTDAIEHKAKLAFRSYDWTINDYKLIKEDRDYMKSESQSSRN